MTRLFSAIGVSLGLTVLIGSQLTPSHALSADLRAHVQNERFQIVTALRGLPIGVRNGLQMLFESQSFDIAEPGAEFDLSDMSIYLNLPIRRMVLAGCSYDHCLVYYERIGATYHTWQVALFHWAPEGTKFVWGGTAPEGLKTVDDVRAGVVSGAIKSSAGPW